MSPAGQTRLLPAPYRVMIIAFQAVIPGIAALTFWVPLTGSQYLMAPLRWLLLACASLVWLVLASRAWQVLVTLTPDMLIVRNVFRTWRVPVTEVTGVRFHGTGALGISVVGPARPADGSPSGGRHAGRHAGRRCTAAAVRLGAAYWSGRRTDADGMADAIAAAAGLPPRQPRKELVSARQARLMLSGGIGLFVLAAVLAQFSQGSSGLVGWAGRVACQGLSIAAAASVVPAGLATLDRVRGRWRKRRGGQRGQAPEIP